MSKGGSNNNTSQKLGLLALVAIVISSMIGSGVDGLPQNMAATSEIGPVIIAWLICGFGMYFIARIFMVLSDIRPDLQSGIYMYAREGFGAFVTIGKKPVANAGAKLYLNILKNSSIPMSTKTSLAIKGKVNKLIPKPSSAVTVGHKNTFSGCNIQSCSR